MHLKWHHGLSHSRRAAAPRRLRLAKPGRRRLYLRSLSERQVVVNIKLRDGETVRGWIEYFDDSMLRLTREGQPNLFIYKNQIRTISEAGRRRTLRYETVDSPARARRGCEQHDGPVLQPILFTFPRPPILRVKRARVCASFLLRAWRPSTRATSTW